MPHHNWRVSSENLPDSRGIIRSGIALQHSMSKVAEFVTHVCVAVFIYTGLNIFHNSVVHGKKHKPQAFVGKL